MLGHVKAPGLGIENFTATLRQRRTRTNEYLVPTARLELAQLSPLPPQDSVSTNFTTSAALESAASAGMRIGSPGNSGFYPRLIYFFGIAPAPEDAAGAAEAATEATGGASTTALAAGIGSGPGIAAAPDAAVAAAGALAAGRSRTLPVVALGRSFAL